MQDEVNLEDLVPLDTNDSFTPMDEITDGPPAYDEPSDMELLQSSLWNTEQVDLKDLQPIDPDEVMTANTDGEVAPDFSELVPMTSDESKNFDVDRALQSGYSEHLAKDLADGPLTAAKAANTMAAAGEFYDKDRSLLEKVFYGLSIPQQAIVRQATNALEDIGWLDKDSAKRMLSHDELYWSDLVNFYMKDADFTGSGVVKFGLGLAADVVLDPLNFVGVGLAKNASKALIKGAGIALDLSKMSKPERMFYKAVEHADAVISADNKLSVGLLKDGMTAEQYQSSLGKLMKKETGYGFKDFAKEVSANPEFEQKIISAAQGQLTEPGFLRELAQKKRAITVGYNIPFTRLFKEVELPIATGAAQGVAKAVTTSYDWMNNFIKTTTGMNIDKAGAMVRSVLTNTGKVVVDAQLRQHEGAIQGVANALNKLGEHSRKSFQTIKETMTDKEFDSFVEHVVDEMEMAPLKYEEAVAKANQFSRATEQSLPVLDDLGRPYNLDVMSKAVTGLTVATERDLARQALLKKYPAAQEFINMTREINQKALAAFEARPGIKFTELNPFGITFGANNARHYAKHVLTDEYKALKKGLDEEIIARDAINELEQNLGLVDRSSFGRQYRGTILDANKYSMEKYGVKMFVDDPIELVSRRALEMERIVQNHDLLEAMSAYARVGSPGESGVWKKLEWNDFSGLTKSDETGGFLKQSYDAFVPDFYKTNQYIYVPQDVYSRVMYQINKASGVKGSNILLKSAQTFHNVFSNAMLFGPGYLGQNMMSNLVTFANNFGLQNMGRIATTTAKFLTKSGKFLVRDLEGTAKYVDYEDMVQAAHEMGIMKSSFYGNTSMADFADNIASMKKDSGWKTTKTLADAAFLWKYNRKIAEVSDVIPKLAAFTMYLEKGFTKEAAAEAVEKYFYRYEMGGRAQDAVSKVIPFSRFSIKSLEMAKAELELTGGLGKIVLPGKVANVFEGRYVADPELRDMIESQYPDYVKQRHPIVGPLLPGQNAVILEAPFALNTIYSLTDPVNNLHPIINGVLAFVNAQRDPEENAFTTEQYIKQAKMGAWKMALPSYLRAGLELYDLNTGKLGQMGLDLAGMYDPQAPLNTSGPEVAPLGVNDPKGKFHNDKEFADAVTKEYGQDFLYNLMFSSNPFEKGTAKYDVREAGKAEFLKRRFRDMTFGGASMTRLDKNMMVNYWSLKKQVQREERELKKEINNTGLLYYSTDMSDEQYEALRKKGFGRAAKILDAKDEMSALVEFYEFITQVNKQNPTNNLFKIVFGMSEVDAEQGSVVEIDELYNKNPDDYSEDTIDNYIDILGRKVKENQ